jgi:hypothetical protein
VQYDPHPQLPLMIGYALIAPRIKVMYVPTTKVACSTLKLLVAQIEGTYNKQAAREIISPNIFSLTIFSNNDNWVFQS